MRVIFLLVITCMSISSYAGVGVVNGNHNCLTCHGVTIDATELKGPQLGALDSTYILEQLRLFRDGSRGDGHPGSRAMKAAVKDYTDAELERIFIWSSKLDYKTEFDYKLGSKLEGYSLYKKLCSGCHDSMLGRFFSNSPSLQSLDYDYINRQLNFYDIGYREFQTPSDHQARMITTIRSLSDNEFDVLTQFIQICSELTKEKANHDVP
jgi:cytochrome c553